MADAKTHEFVTRTLNTLTGRAMARGDNELLVLIGLVGVLNQGMMEQKNDQKYVAQEAVTAVGKTIPVTGLKDGDLVYHGLGTERIMVSAKNEKGFSDYNILGAAEDMDHLVISIPQDETFTGNLIIDIYNG
ncbi:hypothetical protein [Siphonobacter curvatus]|uniref:Uncharacterized protein n=1 Tax=Siphonobacter curvatus TaxID=2094562 RepID=A0A2S7IQZ9_9BACT|nr:hypothetical protein [Siphonobacter curvatus]PQA60134.1 hypothetical protein C5O19_11105 [Siphonobacter curvatus]